MDAVKKYLSEIGRRGGQSRSAAKVAAGKINAAEATRVRVAKQLSAKSKIVVNSDGAQG